MTMLQAPVVPITDRLCTAEERVREHASADESSSRIPYLRSLT